MMIPTRFSSRLIVATFIGLAACIVAADEKRPNVLFFIADNWSSPHASILGDPTVKTPTFDRIAREGLLFENVFCPVPSCSPTRSSLLTGRAAHQLEDAASLWSAFPKKFRVFTELLRERGYEVGYCEKGLLPVRFLEYGWSENPVGKEYKSFEAFLAQRDPNKPFFFWVGNMDTALRNWRYDAEAAPGLDPKSIRVPPSLPDTPEVRATILGYYGAVTRVDQAAARVVDQLERKQLLDETLFIYTSDNGWQMPRGLANCYDSGTKVPMAMRWGNRLKKGKRIGDFICLNDLAPTLLELAGHPIPSDMTARSFFDLIQDKPSTVSRDHLFLERERHANVRAGNLSYPIRGIRTADYLYLRNLRPDRWPAGDPEPWFAVGRYGDCDHSQASEFIIDHAGDPTIKPFFELNFGKRPEEELFDLRTDPDQIVNLAGESKYAGIKQELRKRVEDWMKETADPRVDPSCNVWDDYPYFGNPFPKNPKRNWLPAK